MRTRIVRMFCQAKVRDVWVVQKWLTEKDVDIIWGQHRTRPGLDGATVDLGPSPIKEGWDPVRDFELNEYDKASAFAMDLSMMKKTPLEMAVFDDGVCVSGTARVDSGTTQ
jgi:hypothetical protein